MCVFLMRVYFCRIVFSFHDFVLSLFLPLVFLVVFWYDVTVVMMVFGIVGFMVVERISQVGLENILICIVKSYWNLLISWLFSFMPKEMNS